MILVGMRQDKDVDVGNFAIELLAEIQKVLVHVVAARAFFIARFNGRVAIDDDLGVVAERDKRAVTIPDREVGDTRIHPGLLDRIDNSVKFFAEMVLLSLGASGLHREL
jgi:hypothetical protein